MSYNNKVLILSASNIQDINGLSFNVKQDKIYEFLLEYDNNGSTLSDGIHFRINNDSSNNYLRSYAGNWNGSFSGNGDSGQVLNLVFLSFAEAYKVMTGKFYPFTKTFISFYIRTNQNISPQSLENWIDSYKYTAGQANTINLLSGSDNVPCVFKIWEISD